MEELVIGKVHGPQGTRGALSVTSCSGESAHFLSLRSIKVRQAGASRIMDIDSVQEGPKGLIIHFTGIDSPEAAAELHGAELLAPRDRAAPLGKNEYYTVDLAGCELVHKGQPLATVLSVMSGAQSDLLEAQKPDGTVSLVPFMGEFIGKVDLGKRRIEVLKPWILE